MRGEGIKAGRQSSASEPGSAASARTKLPLPGTRAAPKRPQRRAGGGEGHRQREGSPLLLDQQHQSTLCPHHGLTCFPAWRARAAAESELSLQRAFSRQRSRSHYSSYSGGCERSDPESPFAICSSSWEQQQPPERLHGCCSPPGATCLPSSTTSAEKIRHPERKRGKSFTQFSQLLDCSSKTASGGVRYVPQGLLSVIPMPNYGK